MLRHISSSCYRVPVLVLECISCSCSNSRGRALILVLVLECTSRSSSTSKSSLLYYVNGTYISVHWYAEPVFAQLEALLCLARVHLLLGDSSSINSVSFFSSVYAICAAGVARCCLQPQTPPMCGHDVCVYALCGCSMYVHTRYNSTRSASLSGPCVDHF